MTTFAYDAAGLELSTTDAENQTTVYTYDVLGRRMTTQWPDHVAGTSPGDADYGIQLTEYNPAGRPFRRTDQRGDTITLLYDLAGRTTSREYRTQANSPAGPVSDQDTFTHDAAGRILTAVKGRYANTITFTYDEGGRRGSESLTIDGQTYLVGYSYDAAGRLVTVTYPDGSIVTRGYTLRGQLQHVDLTEPGMTAQTIASFAYDSGGRETTRTYGNGIVTTRTWRADNLVASINSGVENLSYTYDANKNPTSESRSGVMSPYSWSTGAGGFDGENRLTAWNRTNGDSQSWTLSPVNDWQSFTNNGVVQTRTHGSAHEMLTIDSTPIQHDSRGNQTQDDRGTSMTYDADNMLTSFSANAAPGLTDATYRCPGPSRLEVGRQRAFAHNHFRSFQTAGHRRIRRQLSATVNPSPAPDLRRLYRRTAVAEHDPQQSPGHALLPPQPAVQHLYPHRLHRGPRRPHRLHALWRALLLQPGRHSSLRHPACRKHNALHWTDH